MTFLQTNTQQNFENIRSLCLGNFDGIHLAHKELFKRLDKRGAILVIGAENGLLTPLHFRDRYTDCPIYGFFLRDIKSLQAKEFYALLRNIFPNLEKIIVGYDFKMGKNREYSTQSMQREFASVQVEVVQECMLQGKSIHSRIIIHALEQGKIAHANELLGREYSIEGDVVQGQGIGKKLLYPTLNITNHHHFVLPKEGVYATQTKIDDEIYLSATFIGVRETTDVQFAIETHIIDHQPISATSVEIFFLNHIRDNQSFASTELLKEQIKQDIEQIKHFKCK